MQQSIDKVQAANDHEQTYVREVAALRNWVGLPTSQQVWGGVNLMRGTDANEEFIRGWETTESVLQDYAQSIDLRTAENTQIVNATYQVGIKHVQHFRGAEHFYQALHIC